MMSRVGAFDRDIALLDDLSVDPLDYGIASRIEKVVWFCDMFRRRVHGDVDSIVRIPGDAVDRRFDARAVIKRDVLDLLLGLGWHGDGCRIA
jgi:hypothetical protein